MVYTEETVQSETRRLENMIRNSIRAVWDKALMLNRPDLFEHARQPIHFVKDEGQIGQIAAQVGFSVYTIQMQSEMLREELPEYLWLGVPPDYALQLFKAAYAAQTEAVQELWKLYKEVMKQIKAQQGDENAPA